MAARRKLGVRLITGLEDVDRKLATLKLGAANKIARPALTKGARHLLKKAKAQVPPNMKAAKRALGMVVDSKGGKSKNQQRAKVGAAVGKAAKAVQKEDRAGKAGVGIGPENIHWFILGTTTRETGSVQRTGYRKLTGNKIKRTGIMPAQMPHLMQSVATQEKSNVESIIRTEVTTRLAALAATK